VPPTNPVAPVNAIVLEMETGLNMLKFSLRAVLTTLADPSDGNQ
jgi:hypothetical protein